MFARFKSHKLLLVVLVVTALGVFGVIAPVNAQLGSLMADALAGLALIIIELVGKLLIVLIEILVAVVQYNDFINAPAVVKGWILVRDVANMAFLIIFIAIAFATILGVEKYEYKRLLPKLLIMAVAINFSKTICGIIIDAAQVIMITFVNGFKDVAAGNLIRGFGLTDMLSLKEFEGEDAVTPTAVAAAAVLAVVLLTIAVVTVGIIVIMLLARIIFLWILIVLSPLAFMLSAVPGAEGKFNEWWQKFIKYAFVGPILAFFLWLSFSIMANVTPGSNLAEDSKIPLGTVADRTSASISGISDSDQLLSFAIAISLLLLALSTASGMGTAFGGMAGDALSKIKSGGVKLGKIAALGVATGGVGAIAGSLAKKPLWAGAKYLNRKMYASKGRFGGISLDMKDNWAKVKESLERTKQSDLSKGSTRAGERLRAGATATAFLGGAGDAGDAYIKGFAGIKGIKRALKIKFGGPKAARRLQEEVKEDKEEADKLDYEAKMNEDALAKDDYIPEGRQQDEENFVKKRMDEQESQREAEDGYVDYLTDESNVLVTVTIKKDSEGNSVKDSEGNVIEEEKRVSVMDYLEKKGLDPNKSWEDMDDEEKVKYKEVIEQFDDEKARQDYTSRSKKIDEAIRKGDDGDETQKKLLQFITGLGKQQYLDEAMNYDRKAKNLNNGLLSDEEIKSKDDQLAILQQEQIKLLKKISVQKASTGKDATQEQEDRKAEIMEEMKEIGVHNGDGEPEKGKGKWSAKQDINFAEFTEAKAEQDADKAEKKIRDEMAELGITGRIEVMQKENEIRVKRDEITNKAKRVVDSDKDSRAKLAEEAKLKSKRAQLMATVTDLTPDQKKEMQKEADEKSDELTQLNQRIEKKETKAQEYIPPQAFYAERDRRLMENEEANKITTDLDSELIAAMRDAISEKNNIKAVALMKKMAKDGNDNEFLNNYGFTSNAQGMHDFFNAVVIGKGGVKKADGTEYSGPKLGMNQQSAYAAENDISYINESVNHWETARLMDVENGQYKQLGSKEHTQHALAEIMKLNTREVGRAFNRLAYGGEKPRSDGSGRDFEIAPLGVAILKALGPEIGHHISRGEYNKNAVMNMGPHFDKWRDLGIDTDYLDRSVDKFQQLKNEAGEDVSSIVEQVFMLLQKQGRI